VRRGARCASRSRAAGPQTEPQAARGTHSANGPRHLLSCAPFSLSSPPAPAVASARRAMLAFSSPFAFHPSSSSFVCGAHARGRHHKGRRKREWSMLVQCAVRLGVARACVRADVREAGKTAADGVPVALSFVPVAPLTAAALDTECRRELHCTTLANFRAAPSAFPPSSITVAPRRRLASPRARPPCLSHAPMRKDTNDWKTHGRVCRSHWQGN
jgi:hypothetical protein